jgi:hypothetical protein
MLEIKSYNIKSNPVIYSNILNHYLSKKLKLMSKDEFNHLIYILTPAQVWAQSVILGLPYFQKFVMYTILSKFNFKSSWRK